MPTTPTRDNLPSWNLERIINSNLERVRMLRRWPSLETRSEIAALKEENERIRCILESRVK